nr:Mariner Mos1 transposase [Hymenolepis microstoma]
MRLSRALQETGKRPSYKERHDNVILQLDNARPHDMCQSGEKISRNVEVINFISPATVLSRFCSVCWFSSHSPISLNGTRPGSPALQLI